MDGKVIKTIAFLQVSADLIEKGFVVYSPEVKGPKDHVIIRENGGLKVVNIAASDSESSTYDTSGKIYRDILAIYDATNNNVTYLHRVQQARYKTTVNLDGSHSLRVH